MVFLKVERQTDPENTRYKFVGDAKWLTGNFGELIHWQDSKLGQYAVNKHASKVIRDIAGR